MEHLALTESDLEYELGRRQFLPFLTFVWVRDTDLSSAVAMRFELWDHLVFMARVFAKHNRIIILKSRQIGISWLLAAYALWVALYHPGANVLLLSRGKKEAAELLKKVKFIYERLPEAMKVAVGTDSTTEFSFPSINSTITALPATEEAGRSETATLVIQDEADYHEYLEENFAAIRPTVDAGGQHIMASTANYETFNSFFKRQYMKASRLDEEGNSLKDGSTSYVRVFFPWNVRPSRTKEWFEEATKDYDEDRRRKEYPENESQALEAPKAIAAFDHDMLDLMRTRTKPPIPLYLVKGIVKGEIPPDARIFKLPQAGRRYAAASDVSHGVGIDYHVTGVLDVGSGEIVADIFDNQMDEEEFAIQSVKLLRLYDEPIWGIEDNDWGRSVIKTALRMKYRRLYKRDHRLGTEFGWHTDERSRADLWSDLRSAVKTNQLTVYAEDGLAQFYQCVKNPEKRGRIEAQEGGGHDDYPMMVGIAWQLRDLARRSTMSDSTDRRVGDADGAPVRRHRALSGRRW